jgi:hypothetical protein
LAAAREPVPTEHNHTGIAGLDGCCRCVEFFCVISNFQMRQEDGKQRQEAKHGAENDDSDGVDLGKLVFGFVGQFFGHRYCSVEKIPSSQQDWMVAFEKACALADEILIAAQSQPALGA